MPQVSGAANNRDNRTTRISLSIEVPELSIVAQEDLAPLVTAARAIWHANKISETASRRIVFASLFEATDAQHEASGLITLLEDTDPTVVYANDPNLSTAMIANAIERATSTNPRLVIAGPRALATRCDPTELIDALAVLGYRPAERQNLNKSLILEKGRSEV